MDNLIPHSLIEELEEAARIVYSHDGHAGTQGRRKAEEKLTSFRNSKPPINACKSLLEGSRHEAVQFQAATALKDAVIREWSNMDLDIRETLQQFILNYISDTQMPHFIREILAQVIAVIIKMKTVHAKDSCHRESLYRYLTVLLSSGVHEKQLVACSVLAALILEFSMTNRSTNVGLAWNQHAKCKRAFEANDLKSIFCLTVDALGNTISMDEESNVLQDKNGLCKHFLAIAEQILTWSFTPAVLVRRSVMIQATDEQLPFKPGADWATVLLNANLDLFFKLSTKFRKNDELSRLANSCLIQLASLQGAVLNAPETECHYLKYFVENLLRSHGSSQPLDQEALGAASICKNMIECHKLEIWTFNNDMLETFQKFLGFMTELTCFLIARSAEAEANDDGYSFYIDSLQSLLDAWTTVIVTLADAADSVSSYAMRIFHDFLLAHIFPPDGRRAPIDDTDADIDELEEDDRDRFVGLLLSISCLGRTTPHASMLLLTSILEKRIELLNQIILNTDACTEKSVLLNVFEDLHWLLLVACHVLADEPDGETVLIPKEITRCCLNMRNVVSEEATMRLLEFAVQRSGGILVSKDNVDPVIRLVCAVLQLFYVQTMAVVSSRCDHLSPQLVKDTLWFLRIWSSSYLMFEEESYDEIGPILCSAFGVDSDCAQHIVRVVVRMTCSIFHVWTSEKDLLEDAARLLLSLVKEERKCAVVSSCREFWELGHELCNGSPHYSGLPPVVRQAIASSIVFCGTSHMNMYREKYWEQTLDIVKIRYRTLLTSGKGDLMGVNDQETLLAILDLLQGVAEASTAENTPLIFNYLSEFLADGSKMLMSYSGSETIIVSVLELFVEVAHKEICYLHDKKCMLLYNWVLSVLRAYCSISKGLQSKNDEEDSFRDLSLLMELLAQLLNKDFVDFGEVDTGSHTEVALDSLQQEVSVSDVVFFGLGIILPHMNVTLLSYPSLCSQYFKLVTFLCEIYPEKVQELPENILSAFFTSLQLGLNSYGEDNCKLSLEALQSLADFCFEGPSSVLHSLLRPFTKMVFEVILVHAADMELMRTAGDTFFLDYANRTERNF